MDGMQCHAPAQPAGLRSCNRHVLIHRDDCRCTTALSTPYCGWNRRGSSPGWHAWSATWACEELAQDALVIALEKWPNRHSRQSGRLLMATAKHRAIDRLRRSKLQQRKHEEMGHELNANGRTPPPNSNRAWTTTSVTIGAPGFHRLPPVLSLDARVA